MIFLPLFAVYENTKVKEQHSYTSLPCSWLFAMLSMPLYVKLILLHQNKRESSQLKGKRVEAVYVLKNFQMMLSKLTMKAYHV